MTDYSRKDERRDRFVRKKKFKKISTSSKLKETKRKQPRYKNSEIEYEQTIE